MRPLRLLVLGLALVLWGGAMAAIPSDPEPSLLLGETAKSLPDGVNFVVGNDVWQPDQRYRNGSDWLALNCLKTSCTLEPAKLAVRSEKWQGHYDDEAWPGQKLAFSKLKPGAGKVLAWFQVDAKRSWLRPGPVTTYGSSAGGMKRPPSEGTLEVAIDLPEGKQATLVPLLVRENDTFRLQLRTADRRQLLRELGTCSHAVSTDYFVWAGDLDGDGRPDYLISFVDAEGQVLFYLSSVATPGTLVGVAGIYTAPPFGGECDGDGWLTR